MPILATNLDGFKELAQYLRGLNVAQIVVVDASSPDIFAAHHAALDAFTDHIAVESVPGGNGKVVGVLAGLRVAKYECIIIADDDVRYTSAALTRGADLLQRCDVVRPQNFFTPLPWHAVLDTSRSLINRVSGGDWPGTLIVRRSALPHGYRADVLFENLELVRTVRARGGRECVALDLYVPRLPPTASHYASQRVRQAYDEWARPIRLLAALAVVPYVAFLATRRKRRALAVSAACVVAAAEVGRRSSGGAGVFPVMGSILAPVWVIERGVCAWLALLQRYCGGVRYGSSRLRDAATPMRDLKRAHAAR